MRYRLTHANIHEHSYSIHIYLDNVDKILYQQVSKYTVRKNQNNILSTGKFRIISTFNSRILTNDIQISNNS